MLKKSKRILSLVLALIMICSTMGVMAFAAENYEPEQETSKTYTIAIPVRRGNTTRNVYMNITIDGGYSEIDEYSWVDVRSISFYGTWSEFFYHVGPVYSEDYSTGIVDIYYEDIDGLTRNHIYNLNINLSSSGHWEVVGFSYLYNDEIIIDN